MSKVSVDGRLSPQCQCATNFLLMDLLKSVAAHLIVFHHIALYGPLSHIADPLIAPLREGVEAYGLLCVQAFLVMGGYFAMRGMKWTPSWSGRQLLQLLRSRYIRLALPFAVAMVLAIFASLLANDLAPHSATPNITDLEEVAVDLLSHVLLLHSLLGVESLSAGVWYVAIDFQLYALLATVLWVASYSHHYQVLRPLLILGLVVGSLFQFNCQPELDIWGVYFFGSYGLGALAYWVGTQDRLKSQWLWAGMVALVLLALDLEFRIRIVVALSVATLLFLNEQHLITYRPSEFVTKVIKRLSQTSYAVFLVHFPVSLVVNAAVIYILNPGPIVALVGVVLCWICILVAGFLFERWVEKPLRRFA